MFALRISCPTERAPHQGRNNTMPQNSKSPFPNAASENWTISVLSIVQFCKKGRKHAGTLEVSPEKLDFFCAKIGPPPRRKHRRGSSLRSGIFRTSSILVRSVHLVRFAIFCFSYQFSARASFTATYDLYRNRNRYIFRTKCTTCNRDSDFWIPTAKATARLAKTEPVQFSVRHRASPCNPWAIAKWSATEYRRFSNLRFQRSATRDRPGAI